MQTTKNKYASCGKYVLVKPLGSGYNSKVKLGYDSANNSYAAVKMIRHSHPSLNMKTLKKEIEILQALNNPNIVNLVEFQESADYVKKNGSSYKVVAIVMELVPNGELFEYVADSGRFSEEVARSYFRILIETLEYCHNQGITHRDLKPENLLFDADFNLKVADFGFATLLAGKDGSGQLSTILGTESYMAPEIHLRQPYSGPSVDLFASAIILFILYSGTPPFAKADPKNDPHYKLLCVNKHETFWKAHERNKPRVNGQNFYSDEFKSLMNSMLALDPAVRLSLADIKEHAWYNGPIISMEDLKIEFTDRKRKVDDELQRQREAKEKQKLMAKMQTNNFASNAYGGVRPFRSLETEMEDALTKQLDKVNLDAKREIQTYENIGGFNPYTEIFTVLTPDFVFKYLCAVSQSTFNEFSVSDETYKIKAKGIMDEGTCTLNIVLTKVDDGTSCIEFHKKSGNLMTFFKLVDEVKKKLPILECEGDDKETQKETKEL
jgi:serine/threonine protein kinase